MVGQVDLDGDFPHVRLNAADEKNRQGNSIPLRRDVAAELREWLANGGADSRNVLSILGRGDSTDPATTRLFNVPDDLSKVFNRDRAVAGIAKKDDRGRTVDVHALRHTFGTMLSKAGVSPRVAQAAMRHSSLDLTMNVYTDPRLLDVQGAVESLPQISTTSEPNESRQRIAAGAENFSPSAVAVPVAVLVAVPADFSRHSQSTSVTMLSISSESDFANTLDASSGRATKNARCSMKTTSVVQGGQADLNRRPPDPQSGALTN